MPRRKQEQPKRLPSQLDSNDEGGPDGAGCGGIVDEEGWFGNASDTRSESSSYGDAQDEFHPPRELSPDGERRSPTPVHRSSLELLGLGSGGVAFSPQDAVSSVVSSLYGEAASRALGKPLSSNLRRLLEAGSFKLDSGELLGRASRGADSPPIGLATPLTLSPSSHHAQQLSALARKLANNANNGGSASPALTAKQESADNFNPQSNGNGGGGFVWAGVAADKWPPTGRSTPRGSSLSPDSAIQKLKAAANAVLQDKNAVSASGAAPSAGVSSVAPPLSRGDDVVRFDAFSSPFSPQSASSTLAALSKKVSERSQGASTPGTPAADHQNSPTSFLSLVSMTSSAALLKEVAARAAGNLLAEKKEGSPLPGAVLQEDVKPVLVDKNRRATTPSTPTPSTPTQSLEMMLPSTPKGKGKPNSQAGSPEDGGKPFQCPVCGLVIKRKSYWKRHMVIHTGLKSHQCPLCPFRCARKDNLKSHMKVHQHQDRGETFQCELCPFTSSRHFSLKLHMRCHQHFPRTDVKVKEELAADAEGEGSRTGDGRPGSSPTPDADAAPDGVRVKEEPLERDLTLMSPFGAGRERPASSSNSLDLSGVGVRSSPGILNTASLFSPDISTKTATDLLMKLSAANQREALKSPFHLKEEPKTEEEESSPRPASRCQIPPTFPGTFCPDELTGSLKTREGSPSAANSLLSQDINVKVASELLIKLSENNKDGLFQKVKVKCEPMEVDPAPAEASPAAAPPTAPPPPPPHLLALGTLGAREKTEVPEPLARPQKDIFSQDISVKMASELLFKLSEKVSKANHHKDGNMAGLHSPFLDECFGQSPFNSRSKSSSPAEAGSSTRPPFHDSEKEHGETGNDIARWRLNDQLFPCPVCGKVFGRQQTLSRHLALHTEERKYKCHLCPYAAKCKANLNQHLSIHSVKLVTTDAEQIVTAVAGADNGERKNSAYYYSCHVCGFRTELNAHFVGHMSLHVDKDQWMFSLCCATCDFVCVDEGDMKNHVGAGHAGLSSRSPLSETKSTSSSLSALSDSLNSSEAEELKGLLAPPSSAGSQSSSGSHSGSEDKSEKGFECVFCTFVCKTRSMYERHLQIHLIARMFECDVCHKFLKTPEQLLEHKKCHSVPAGGLKCPLCLYSSGRPAAMECHLKTHLRTEHRCRICRGLWPDRPSLEAHARRAHRLGNHYRCERCGYLSKTANKLIEHVRVHTGERPFLCDRCPYRCKRKDNLNLHKRLKHAAGAGPAEPPAPRRPGAGPRLARPPPEPRGNGQRARLIPLTTLFGRRDSAFQAPPLLRAPKPRPSRKHSFLAYLGLTERARTP
ncbi:zinc finger protein 827 isoform X1 [Stigmatopora nigra]